MTSTDTAPEPAFEHSSPGTPSSDWDELVAAQGELALPGPGDRLVVLAAHPDDESLGAGGLLATVAERGCGVTVVVATDGDASHPDSPTHRGDQLAARRRREVYAAVSALAPSAEVLLLGLPDGRLADHTAELVDALTPVIAGCTHLVTPWVGDRHPDHEACARVAGELTGGAASTGPVWWQYPIWAWHWDRAEGGVLAGQELGRVVLDARAHAAKRAALASHLSQHSPLSDAPGDEAILSPALLAAADRPVELYVVAPVTTATSVDYFAGLYRQAEDPWGLDERFYERRKRAAVLAALPQPRYGRVFEPGCATGALSAELARRSDELVAWDVVPAAVAATSARLTATPGAGRVTVAAGRVPDEWPAGPFDLVVLSEVGYYCADLGLLAARVDASLAADGTLLACHWRHAASMHVHTAGAVHAALGGALHLVVSHVEDDFLLQVWTRTGQSVAAAAGIVG